MPTDKNVHKDSHIILAGVIMLALSSLLFFMQDRIGLIYGLLYIKLFVVIFSLCVAYYGWTNAEAAWIRLVSIFSLIFVVCKVIYEVLLFSNLIESDSTYTIKVFYLIYSAVLWIYAIYTISKYAKKI